MRREATNAKDSARPTADGQKLIDRLKLTQDEQRMIARARRQGWTEAKIQEWVLTEKANEMEVEIRLLEVAADPPTKRNVAIDVEINKLKGIIAIPEKAGGSYKDVRAKASGGQVNHIPSFTGYEGQIDLTYDEGPSIWMTEADHAKMTSTGRSTEAMGHHEAQRALVAQGKFVEAMEMDISEIRETFKDGRYEKGIRQMLEYVKRIDPKKLTPKAVPRSN